MNKTLLLIIVDFLFLNLIALTRWERAEPTRPVRPPVAEAGAGQTGATQDQDLLATMRQSLASEQASREQVESRLAAGDAALAARQQTLDSERARTAALASDLSAARKAQADLSARYTEAYREAGEQHEDLTRTRHELDDSAAEAERQRQALEELRRQQEESRRQIASLTLAASLAEQEKAQLAGEADHLRTEVQVERTERLNVEKTTGQLAQGVGQLAVNSGQLTQETGELSKEIHDNQPVSANRLFQAFQANQVQVRVSGTRPGFFGSVNRSSEAPAAVVADSTGVYALLHVEDTLFSLGEVPEDWDNVTVQVIGPGGVTGTAPGIRFLAADPRAVAVQLPPALAHALAPKAYRIAGDPFHFTDATLIERTGGGYGDVGFKLDPDHPGYVRVDNRLFKRLFGDFSPSRGDLVLSRTGELLGIMVNSDYCALIRGFPSVASVHAGSGGANPGGTAVTLGSLGAQVKAMPLDLQ